jgi:hypothetical protein
MILIFNGPLEAMVHEQLITGSDGFISVIHHHCLLFVDPQETINQGLGAFNSKIGKNDHVTFTFRIALPLLTYRCVLPLTLPLKAALYAVVRLIIGNVFSICMCSLCLGTAGK